MTGPKAEDFRIGATYAMCLACGVVGVASGKEAEVEHKQNCPALSKRLNPVRCTGIDQKTGTVTYSSD